MNSRFRLAVLVVGIVALIVALRSYDQAMISGLYPDAIHSNDFKHMWIGARLVSHGLSPYEEINLFTIAHDHDLGGINPYVYLPFPAQVMMPLGKMEFSRAVATWFALNHAMLLVAMALAAWTVTRREDWCWWPLITALGVFTAGAMMPLMRQTTAGQMNCAIALLFVGILMAGEREKFAWLLGLLIAFGALFKLAPGLFGVYLLWKRAWRPLGWAVGWGVVLWGISIAHSGVGLQMEFFPLLKDMRIGHSTWAHHGMAFHCDPANQAMGSFLSHILAADHDWNLIALAHDPNAIPTTPWVDLGVGWANGLTLLFTLALLGLLVWSTSGAWSAMSRWTWRMEWGLIVLGSLLIPSLCWDHYVVQLLPVLVVLWGLLRVLPSVKQRLAVGVPLVAVSLLLSWWVRYDAIPNRSGGGLLVMSIRLWGMLLLLGLLVGCHRLVRRESDPQN